MQCAQFRLDAGAGGDDELAPLGEYLARYARCADVSLLPHKTWRAALREQDAESAACA